MTQSDWDNTPWAGTAAAQTHALALAPLRKLEPVRRSATDWIKAVGGPGALAMMTEPFLSDLRGNNPQERAKRFLSAYRVGWFNKAGRRISQDVGALDVRLVFQDDNDNGDETIIRDPGMHVPLDELDPEEQLIRLMHKPNDQQSGRSLRQEMQIRLDFGGSTFLYLEGVDDDPTALPTAIYGISPARMWPAYDKAGNILGWVMDADRPGQGVPFKANEIIHISNASERDDDIWGVSVVEAVFAEVPLTTLVARHTTDLLTTGGRLAGMLWPKERTLGEDEFQDALRAWRNVANDPNAARRLLMFPEPMEFAKGAATPAEIGIPELAALHQTQVLTAFPIGAQMLGVPAPAGLNSGETRRWDRKEYWEGTIHPRADIMSEAIDRSLVGRYEQAIGQALGLSLIEHALDDPAALVEKAGAMRSLISLGFDARDAIVAVGLTGVKWRGLPPNIDPMNPANDPANAMMTGAQSQGARTGGMRVLAGDTNASDSTVIQQEVIGSKKALDELLDALPDRKQERIKGVADIEAVAGAPDAVRALLDLGLRRGYTNAQIADGVPSERFDGLRTLIEQPPEDEGEADGA